MSSETHDELSRLFGELLAADAEQRTLRLAEIAKSEPQLAAELEELLRHHARPANAIAAIDASLVAATQPSALPSRIGPYTILGVLGRGGMGLVYRAEQSEPRRLVALKVLLGGASDPDLMKRFRREMQLLAALKHPGIAAIYDVGTCDLGAGEIPYFTMELVDGATITDYARKKRLDVAARCRLFAKVCDAAQHAHETGIVHRDLKPGNVLVAPPASDGRDPQPKILDFGVARGGTNDPAPSLRTMTGELLGTLGYMPPEQLAAGHGTVDAQSDVYALGVMLYELLVDRLPIDVTGRTVPEVMRMVEHDDPTSLGRYDRTLRGDLETICGKALQKEKVLRYESAADLAADLRRYLDGRPIAARPQTTWYHLRKFARRNRTLVFGVAATMLALTVGLIGTLTYASEASQLAADEVMARRRLQQTLYQAEMRLAGNEVGPVKGRSRIREIIAGWLPAPDREDLRGWEWYFLEAYAVAGTRSIAPRDGRAGMHPFHWQPDGQLACGSTRLDRGRIWELGLVDLDSGRMTQVIGRYHVQGCELSPDRTLVALPRRSSLAIVRYPSGELVQELPFDGMPTMLSWSPDGRWLGVLVNRAHVVPADSRAEVRRVADWARVADLDVQPMTHNQLIDFSADSRWLAVDNGREPGGGVAILRTSDWQRERYVGRDRYTIALEWHPRRSLLAVGSHEGGVGLYEPDAGFVEPRLSGHDRQVSVVRWSPDGNQLATGALDGSVRSWDLATGHGLLLGTHRTGVAALCWSPDSQRLASGANEIRIWDPTAPPAVRELAHGAGGHIAWHPDSRQLVVQNGDSTQLLDVATGSVLAEYAGHSPRLHGSGKLLACRDGDQIVVRELGGSGHDWRLAAPGPFVWHARDPLLMIDNGAQSLGWRPGSSQPPAVLVEEHGWLREFAWDATGDELWLLHGSGRLIVRNTATGTVDVFGGGRHNLCFGLAPNGDRIATGTRDHLVVLLSRNDAAERLLRGHSDEVHTVAWSPDGHRIASGGRDGTARIWDPTTGAELLALRHGAAVVDVAWSPDGTMLASTSSDGVLRVWDARVALGR